MINLVFMIAPRVNAAGRMDDARKVVHLFTSPDLEEALSYAGQLQTDNIDRKEADLNTTEEALALLEKDLTHSGRRSTVLYQPHWHKGVVGIVASRLIERYYRPTVVLTLSGERKLEKEEKQENFHRVEHRYGTFARTFSLPSTVDPESWPMARRSSSSLRPCSATWCSSSRQILRTSGSRRGWQPA